MEAQEALRRLKSRKNPGRVRSKDDFESPLFQALKGILALFGPIILVYFGYYYMSRGSALKFVRGFLSDLSQEHYAEVYQDRCVQLFRDGESFDSFVRRTTEINTTLGSLEEVPLETFDAHLLQGFVELRYTGEVRNETLTVVLVLVRTGTNSWQCAQFRVERAPPSEGDAQP